MFLSAIHVVVDAAVTIVFVLLKFTGKSGSFKFNNNSCYLQLATFKFVNSCCSFLIMAIRSSLGEEDVMLLVVSAKFESRAKTT
jgi:hypothetical protein